jgi:amidase
MVAWEEKAAAKRASIISQIRQEWRLSEEDLERVSRERTLAGDVMDSFLDDETRSITSMTSVPLVEGLRAGSLSAVQVTMAFCKAAAVAHQIVCPMTASPAVEVG